MKKAAIAFQLIFFLTGSLLAANAKQNKKEEPKMAIEMTTYCGGSIAFSDDTMKKISAEYTLKQVPEGESQLFYRTTRRVSCTVVAEFPPTQPSITSKIVKKDNGEGKLTTDETLDSVKPSVPGKTSTYPRNIQIRIETIVEKALLKNASNKEIGLPKSKPEDAKISDYQKIQNAFLPLYDPKNDPKKAILDFNFKVRDHEEENRIINSSLGLKDEDILSTAKRISIARNYVKCFSLSVVDLCLGALQLSSYGLFVTDKDKRTDDFKVPAKIGFEVGYINLDFLRKANDFGVSFALGSGIGTTLTGSYSAFKMGLLFQTQYLRYEIGYLGIAPSASADAVFTNTIYFGVGVPTFGYAAALNTAMGL